MSETDSIEVFQDLTLRGVDSPAKLRTALVEAAASKGPWRHSVKKEAISFKSRHEDVMVFEHSTLSDSVALFMFSTTDGYRVTNIVPKQGELSRSRYNELLQQFVQWIAEPAAKRVDAVLELSKAQESLSDWMPEATANLLISFSRCANRSTGSSHPKDRARWFEFLIASHSGPHCDTDHLSRWLIEVEKWPEESATKLVLEYEFGLDLLSAYAETP